MKTYGLWITGVALLLLTGIPALTAVEARKEALPPEYAAMVTQLNLNDDQQAQLRVKLEATKTSQQNWEQAHHEQISKLQADIRGEDKVVAAKSRQQLDSLMNERNKLTSTLKADILTVLSPDQQQTWAALQLYRQNHLDEMVKFFALTADQETKLKEAEIAYITGHARWEQENGEKFIAMQKQVNELNAMLNSLKEALNKMDTDQAAAIAAMLTPEQQIAWRAHGWQTRLEGMFNRTKLTDDQLAKIKDMCLQASKTLPSSTNIMRSWGDMPRKLQDDVNAQVLTDAQRTAMTVGK